MSSNLNPSVAAAGGGGLRPSMTSQKGPSRVSLIALFLRRLRTCGPVGEKKNTANAHDALLAHVDVAVCKCESASFALHVGLRLHPIADPCGARVIDGQIRGHQAHWRFLFEGECVAKNHVRN